MRAWVASRRAGIVCIAAVGVIAGCGADETAGFMPSSMTPSAAGAPGLGGATPSAAGARSPGLAGSPSSGTSGTSSTGSATAGTFGGSGRGTAGTGTSGTAAPSGTSGTGAAGSGGIGGTIAGGTGGVLTPAGTSGGSAGTAAAGTGGAGGTGGAAGAAGTPAMMGTGTCCPSGDCLCHGPDPKGLTAAKGPFPTMSQRISSGTVYYPAGDAKPPFAAVAICGGFLNTGPEMEGWGPFYASYGIVTVITTTTGADLPDLRGAKLLAAIDELKKMNSGGTGPLAGKLAGRYGTSGYSMGGGGTTLASGEDATLKTSVGLAAWGGVGEGVKVATLLFCGDADTVAPCAMSDGVYGGIPTSTPKMKIVIPGSTHFNWFGPTDTAGQTSGKYALAFQKVFLEGDERWKPLLLMKPSGGSVETNIK